jgi:hypothetical protein
MPCTYCCCPDHDITICDSEVLLSKWKDTIYRVIHAINPERLIESAAYSFAADALRHIEIGLLRSIAARFCQGMLVFERDVVIRKIIMTIRQKYPYWLSIGYLPDRLENRRWEAHPSYVQEEVEPIRIGRSPIEIQEADKQIDITSLRLSELMDYLTSINMLDAVADIRKHIAEAERIRIENINSLIDCPICFDEKKMRLMCRTNCNHIFCKLCIAKHFNQNSNKCPMCREEMRTLRNLV